MTIDTSDLRQFGRELRAMKHAFLAEHGRHPRRVVWSPGIEHAVIAQEMEIARRFEAAGVPTFELDPAIKGKSMGFVRIDGPPGTFYVDDKEGNEP